MGQNGFLQIIVWTEAAIFRYICLLARNMKAAKVMVQAVHPFNTFPPTSLQNNSWMGNHPVNQTSPPVWFWWDAGAGNTIRSLPDEISVIDWNNRRSETMKQPRCVCPCHITSVWMLLTRKEPLFRMGGLSTGCHARGGWHTIKACVSIKVSLIQAFEWWLHYFLALSWLQLCCTGLVSLTVTP